ncbi:MAG TPA: ATP-binding protein [Lachnospiraceae bacterium]|nr:ATP-binding protein [Lachnospiraceae bacterium]
MKPEELQGRVRRAVDEFHMIDENDSVAVGLSGGKDSIALLTALSGLSHYYPKHFTVRAVTVDLGLGNIDLQADGEYCEKLGVPYTVIKSDIGRIVFDERKENNPCSLCAKMRKGALNRAMLDAGCNKIAYAHHKDDIVETFLLSLIYEGRLHVFSPVTYLDRSGLTVIRPLMYLSEQEIINFVNEYRLPVLKSPCPANGHTKREYAKNLLKKLETEAPGTKERMFTALLGSALFAPQLKP